MSEQVHMATVIVVLLLLGLGGIDPVAQAQEPDHPAIEQLRDPIEPLTRDAIHVLVSTLSDNQVRALLLERLDAVSADRNARPVDLVDGMSLLSDRTATIQTRVGDLVGSVVDLPSVFPRALATLRDERPTGCFFWLTAGFALMMLVGWFVELLFKRATRGARQAIITSSPEGVGAKIGLLVARFGLDLAGLVIFLSSALSSFLIFHQGYEMTRATVMTYPAVVGVVRFYSLFARFLLAPGAPALRIDKMRDEDARFLHRASTGVAFIAAFGFLTCSLLGRLGIVGDVHQLMLHMVGLAMTIALIITLWVARHGIRNNLVEDVAPNHARSLFADAWPYLVFAFLIFFFLIVTLTGLGGGQVSYVAAFGTLFAVIFLPPIDAMIERAAHGSLKAGQGGQIQAWDPAGGSDCPGGDRHHLHCRHLGGRFPCTCRGQCRWPFRWRYDRYWPCHAGGLHPLGNQPHRDRAPDCAGRRGRAGGDGR